MLNLSIDVCADEDPYSDSNKVSMINNKLGPDSDYDEEDELCKISDQSGSSDESLEI